MKTELSQGVGRLELAVESHENLSVVRRVVVRVRNIDDIVVVGILKSISASTSGEPESAGGGGGAEEEWAVVLLSEEMGTLLLRIGGFWFWS